MYLTQKKPQRPVDADTPKANRTGIPDPIKARFEALSGLSYDDVRVHYRSESPAQLQAYAFTRGNEVFIAPGQERHLPHELVHIAQQKSGMVQPTRYIAGVPINDDASLESQAEALRFPSAQAAAGQTADTAQRAPGLHEGTRVEIDNGMGLHVFGTIVDFSSEDTYIIQTDKIFWWDCGPMLTIDQIFVAPIDSETLVTKYLQNSTVIVHLPMNGLPMFLGTIIQYDQAHSSQCLIHPDPIFKIERAIAVESEHIEVVKHDITKVESLLRAMTENQGIEFGLVQAGSYFSDIQSGRAADSKTRENASVSFPEAFTEGVKTRTGVQDIVVTHTHPNGSPFSSWDIIMAVKQNYKEIRAVGALGTYSLRRRGARWPVADIDVNTYFAVLHSEGIPSCFPQYANILPERTPYLDDKNKPTIGDDLSRDMMLVEHFAVQHMADSFSGALVYTYPPVEELIARRRVLYTGPIKVKKAPPKKRGSFSL